MSPREQVILHIVMENGTPYYVGGCVRDELMGLVPKDFDVEVFSMSPTKLREVLEQHGEVNLVGESFAVMKVRLSDGTDMDFSTPRRERKEGRGYKGFVVEADENMTLVEAASRRDFTINAIYKNADTGEIVDPFDGRGMTYLHPVSERFPEDPLRVLRGMQFAGRFNLVASEECRRACQALFSQYNSLPYERVWNEWLKWAEKSKTPSAGIDFLHCTGWLVHYPEIASMLHTPQDPGHHPEGDVYTHTLLVCDAMAEIADRNGVTGEDRAVLMFAALCHDMGKPSTTVFERERWRSPGHDQAGVPIARKFLESIGCLERIIVRVLPLVAEHMFPHWNGITRKMVRKLKHRLVPCTIDELMMMIEADYSGRPPLPTGLPKTAERIIELNQELPAKIEPVITGRHIMELGVKDGKTIGAIKRRVFEAQIDEQFDATDLLSALKFTRFIIAQEFSHAFTGTDA